MSGRAAPDMSEDAARPAWTEPENLRWAWWGWEPLAHRRRLGGQAIPFLGNARWAEAWHERLFSDATIRQMRALGVNTAVTHFFKGFGLRFEREAMMQTRDFVRRCHAHGLRVIGYTQFGSLYYEQFLIEQPRAAEWCQRHPDGSVGARGSRAYYRWNPCVNSPEFLAYLKRVVTYGARTIGLDGFHFDNTYARPCYCDRCRALFRAHLRRTVRDATRLGFRDVSRVAPPPYSEAPAIGDPLYQEWIAFRVACLARAWREVYTHVKKLNPDLCVLTNPAFPRSPGWANRLGFHPAACGPFTDLMFAENGNLPRLERGRVVTQVRAFKFADAAGYRVVPTAWRHSADGIAGPDSARQVKLSLAEAAACGGVAGTTWALRTTGPTALEIDRPALAGALRQYLAFLDRHRDLYAGAVTEAAVALLHSFESFAYRGEPADRHTLGVEQTLIEASVPYDVVFAERLAGLERYRLLILPGQTCLSDATVARLRDYVEKGGRLLLSGQSGCLDEAGLARGEDPFRGWPAGRVVRLPEQPGLAADRERGIWLDTDAIPLPPGHRALLRTLDRLLGAAKRPFAIRAPRGVLAQWRGLPDGRRVLHLLDYRPASRPRGRIAVRFRPDIAANRPYAIHSPDGGGEQTGRFGPRGGLLTWSRPFVYKLVVVG